jgi:hypothetical protein
MNIFTKRYKEKKMNNSKPYINNQGLQKISWKTKFPTKYVEFIVQFQFFIYMINSVLEKPDNLHECAFYFA